jgi:hypothetical protein
VGPADPGTSLEQLVREHAALRRVATLVAREPSPAEVFEAVAREVGTLLGASRAQLVRVMSAEEAVVAASWSDGTLRPVPVGNRAPIDGRGVLGRMLSDLRPVRIENWDEVGGGVAAVMRSLGIRSGAAGPIVIGGRLWGAVAAVWSDAADMAVGAEDRVAAFAELVAYAIENAEARDQLDGGMSDLRDLARGIHPSVLTDRGLAVALEALAKRAPLPVDVHVAVGGRVDQSIEAAAYFLVSEAITNAAKHAQAKSVSVGVEANGDAMVVTVADDGVGGAETTRGSGLGGLIDRVEAVGGRLEIASPPGGGTRLSAHLPTHVLGDMNGR